MPNIGIWETHLATTSFVQVGTACATGHVRTVRVNVANRTSTSANVDIQVVRAGSTTVFVSNTVPVPAGNPYAVELRLAQGCTIEVRASANSALDVAVNGMELVL